MQMHRMRITVPESHRAVVEFPENIRSGPVDVIVLVRADQPSSEQAAPARGRLAALAADLRQSSKPFDELDREARRERLRRARGSCRGLTSGSEGFAQEKEEEVALEDRKIDR